MFDLNTRFQIVSMIVLLCIAIDYFRYPRLKTLSSKFFVAMLAATFVNLCFDMCSVYTITHIDTVTPWVNRLAHQCFIASVILCIFMNFMYVTIIGREQKRLELQKYFWISIPLLVSFVVIVFGPLDYHVTADAAYSYGGMAYGVYVCGFFYLLMESSMTISKKYSLNKEQRKSIWFVMLIWFITLVVQIIWPHILISGVAMTLIMLSVYLCFENQKENMDAAVGGFNKTAFHHMLDEYYAEKKELYIVNTCCDNLEQINSLFGHDAGTNVLKQIRDQIQEEFSGNVYHSRSNVLSIFLFDDPKNHTVQIERLAQSLEEMKYSSVGLKYHIGIMDIRNYTSTKDDVFELMNFMNASATLHENQIVFLDKELANQKKRQDDIYKLLENAMENDGFEVYYQPIYWPQEGKYRSAEALVRLKDYGELGYVSPEEYIPIAEKKGLILELGRRVFEQVAIFIQQNKTEEYGLKYIEVNLSALQAVAPDIPEQLEKIIKKYNVPASKINIEITETAMVENSDMLEKNMKRLRELGFSFSMDDFGTGYSNLAQVVSTPYELIKLDKSLIWPAFGKSMEKDAAVSGDEEKRAGELLDSMIRMLDKLNKQIVAEGVETQEMADYLIKAGVDHLQGYYYSKPVPANEYLKNILGSEMLEKEHVPEENVSPLFTIK